MLLTGLIEQHVSSEELGLVLLDLNFTVELSVLVRFTIILCFQMQRTLSHKVDFINLNILVDNDWLLMGLWGKVETGWLVAAAAELVFALCLF